MRVDVVTSGRTRLLGFPDRTREKIEVMTRKLIMHGEMCVPRGRALRDEMWVVSYFLWCDHVTCACV
jgi:hypothetical protein